MAEANETDKRRIQQVRQVDEPNDTTANETDEAIGAGAADKAIAVNEADLADRTIEANEAICSSKTIAIAMRPISP